MEIEFVSYSGEWPTLCSGVAVFKIDGKEVRFGHEACSYDSELNAYPDDNYAEFWRSGGECGFRNDYADEYVEEAEWQLNDYWNEADEKHPQWIIDILPQLLKLFNENVEYGCCGGCI